jgi:hypothetical protein
MSCHKQSSLHLFLSFIVLRPRVKQEREERKKTPSMQRRFDFWPRKKNYFPRCQRAATFPSKLSDPQSVINYFIFPFHFVICGSILRSCLGAFVLLRSNPSMFFFQPPTAQVVDFYKKISAYSLFPLSIYKTDITLIYFDDEKRFADWEQSEVFCRV